MKLREPQKYHSVGKKALAKKTRKLIIISDIPYLLQSALLAL
jgi:hypothetical protein